MNKMDAKMAEAAAALLFGFFQSKRPCKVKLLGATPRSPFLPSLITRGPQRRWPPLTAELPDDFFPKPIEFGVAGTIRTDNLARVREFAQRQATEAINAHLNRINLHLTCEAGQDSVLHRVEESAHYRQRQGIRQILEDVALPMLVHWPQTNWLCRVEGVVLMSDLLSDDELKAVVSAAHRADDSGPADFGFRTG